MIINNSSARDINNVGNSSEEIPVVITRTHWWNNSNW